MNSSINIQAALTFTLLLSTTGCATIAGTVASPITGPVDLARYHHDSGITKLGLPFAIVGGVVAGPFAAIYNGLRMDSRAYASEGFYHGQFGELFRPFELIDRELFQQPDGGRKFVAASDSR